MREGDSVSANVLGESSGLTGRHVGFPNAIQQSSLAVVHMAHNRHHRRTRNQLFGLVFDVQLELFDWSVDNAAAALALLHFEPESILGADPFRDRFINGLVDIGEYTRLHQVSN